LGERLLCKQEVIGSIPFTSTITQCASRIVASRGSGLVQKRAPRSAPYDRAKQCLPRA
jgi:hypothetical protein